MNIATITRKTQRLFGDSADEVLIKKEDIWDWVNEAQLKIVRETDCLTKSVTSDASTYPLALPADWIKTKRLTYGTIPLKQVTIDDLDSLRVDLTENNFSSEFYYIFANTIRLYPDLGATDTTDVVHDYVCLPTEIIADGTALSVPVSYHEDIVRFCIMRAHERNENYKAMEISQAILVGSEGLRKEEATLQGDDYFIVRDDPNEDW